MHLYFSGSAWKLATLSARVLMSVCPSRRRKLMPCFRSTHTSIKSIISTPCEKIRTRCPRAISAGNIAATHLNFALCATRESRSRGSFRSSRSTVPPAPAAPTSSSGSSAATARGGASADAAAIVAAEGVARPDGFGGSLRCGQAARKQPPAPGNDADATERTSCHSPGSATGSPSAGWLHRRLRRPIALNTSRPSLVLSLASRITSLVARACL
mmetsp:Transcript_48006/g.129413  ORF Transcript_48006/g.129413 Transcript_48006/m.129413 type:complete len:214 (-) Transcript_48006:878-1519(-)